MTNEILLDELLGQLESTRAWSPRVISKLETLIRTGDDDALFRLNPFQFATEKGIAEAEGIDLFYTAPGWDCSRWNGTWCAPRAGMWSFALPNDCFTGR